MHIAIIDRNTKILNKYKNYLKPYFKNKIIDMPSTFFKFLEKNSTDLLLLGIGNSNKDALEIYELIKKNFPSIPTIFLGENIEEKEILRALELGADDVLRYPITSLELCTRIKNKIQKSKKQKSSISRIISSKIILNKDFDTIFIDEKNYALSSQEFKIISILSNNIGKFYSTSDLEKAIWGQFEGSKNSLVSLINNLRKRVPELKGIIVNKKNLGYCFLC